MALSTYNPTKWVDEVDQYEHRFRESVNSDGSVDHIKERGTVYAQGTPLDAYHFNHMEDGIFDAHFAAILFMNAIRQAYWNTLKNAQDITDNAADADHEISLLNIALNNLTSKTTLDKSDTDIAVTLLMNVLRQTIVRLDGEIQHLWDNMNQEFGTATLTNTYTFPFNNSSKTVALSNTRDNLSYVVEILSVSGDGKVGEIEITDRQVNGFKMRFTSSAKSAVVNYCVIGGYD